MKYRTLRQCVNDLEAAGQLVRIEAEIDPRLEAAQIQRRVCAAGGPALYFARVRGCRFPMTANLFGTVARMEHLFRDTLDDVRRLVELKIDPSAALRHLWRHLSTLRAATRMAPRYVRRGAVQARETTIRELPQLVSWPRDGGAFITLPQVYTEDPDAPGWRRSNLGMYRVQLSGGQYAPDREIGLHYQIHRGIGVHHAAAIRHGEPLRAAIWVGGPPALTVAAVMPLPEGLPELSFAGALGGRRVPLVRAGKNTLHAEADFCIVGTIDPDRRLPEGPFGDHLGYYALAHDFPVLRVEHIYCREDAIWPFTTVGRPPQEDTSFGRFIHELTGPIVPTLIAGVRAVHAVDEAGVHPLLLAIGSERYWPDQRGDRPQELLTQANAILGQGQMSLAKYLWIVNGDDDPRLKVHDIAAFFTHALRRVDWRRDLHFQTCTTIDTLDYSGDGLNQGSKLVVAAIGEPRRALPVELPPELRLPEGYTEPRVALPGVLVVQGPKHARDPASAGAAAFCQAFLASDPINEFPLIVVTDDSDFASATLANWLWISFTRSNPAADVDGIESFVQDKHWGCRGSLVIDARVKPQHAPALEEDSAVTKRVDSLAARGGPLHGIL